MSRCRNKIGSKAASICGSRDSNAARVGPSIWRDDYGARAVWFEALHIQQLFGELIGERETSVPGKARANYEQVFGVGHASGPNNRRRSASSVLSCSNWLRGTMRKFGRAVLTPLAFPLVCFATFMSRMFGNGLPGGPPNQR